VFKEPVSRENILREAKSEAIMNCVSEQFESPGKEILLAIFSE
jgi:hypothetical protein